MIRRYLGGAAITAAATALLFSTLTAGTANAAVGAITVQQLNANLIPVCAQNYVVANLTAPKTIHDPTCAGAVMAAITTTTAQPITVRTDYAVLTMLATSVTPIGPNGINIDVPAGL
ncbi:MAG: hypothetical protein ACRDRR_20070 [Pseudonocardiaceae bacterium]